MFTFFIIDSWAQPFTTSKSKIRVFLSIGYLIEAVIRVEFGCLHNRNAMKVHDEGGHYWRRIWSTSKQADNRTRTVSNCVQLNLSSANWNEGNSLGDAAAAVEMRLRHNMAKCENQSKKSVIVWAPIGLN